MEINDDQLFEFMQSVQRDLGEIKAGMKNNYDYIENVAKKINWHADDTSAHGLGAIQKSSEYHMGWIAIVVAILSAIGTIWQAVKMNGGGLNEKNGVVANVSGNWGSPSR